LDLSDTLDSRGIWASDISYVNGKFYIFATLRYNYQTKEEHPMRAQLMMCADKPEGSYSKPVILPIDNIDPSLFVDDDGRKYMIIAPGVTAVPLSDDCKKVIGKPIQVWAGTGERCPEGPHILKKDGWYYAILAEGGTGYGHGINIGRSKSLYGEYEPCPYNPVLRQKDPDALIQRAGHGKLVQTQNGDWYCMYLCGRRNGGNYTTIGRETALDPVTWTDDGWFTVNDSTPSIKQDFPKLPCTEYHQNTFEDFKKPLSLNWEWVRNPDYDMFLQDENGLVLKTTKGRLCDITAKNTLLRRETELKFTAIAKIRFSPKTEGAKAGLVSYYSTATYLSFSKAKKNGKYILSVDINRNRGEENICEIEIKDSDIVLKIEVDGLTRKCSFSYNNKDFTDFCTLENCIYLCDEGVPDDPKRHTGTLTGIFANRGDNENIEEALFEWFDYKTE
ncbi:MAG: family 43 glycosylhydrolase, partial [Firmicutes bacterium]|nr:family 43 glycosylhydrolase [Bacillota bacterium]